MKTLKQSITGPTFDANSRRLREHSSSFSHTEPGDEIPHDLLARRLREFGIAVPPASRFARYLQLVGQPKASRPRRDVAGLEVTQLAYALQSLGSATEWVQQIEDAVRYDAELPGEHAASTRGRDTQAELYVAGRLSEIGAALRRAEPDLSCTWGGRTFGVAVKRVKSRAQLVKRVKEGMKQITRSGQPGLVCVDLTPIFQHYIGTTGKSFLEMDTNFGLEFLDKEFEVHTPEMQRAASSADVLGVIAFACMGGWAPPGRWFAYAAYHNGYCTRPRIDPDWDFVWRLVDEIGKPPQGASTSEAGS